ncbi:phosphoenolpyruvate carboxykinase (ATP) [Trifolium repens]|nr:phosphoenolpyruvate carboxykinase (ATP) [Trifolium repens]
MPTMIATFGFCSFFPPFIDPFIIFDSATARWETWQRTLQLELQTIAAEGPRGLYKGMGAPLATVAAFNALLFTVRGQMESLVRSHPGAPLTVNQQFVCGAGAGVAVSFLACPTELIKCRPVTLALASQKLAWRVIQAPTLATASYHLNVEYKKTEIFGLEIPTEVEGVPSEILDPENTWSDKTAYKETLLKLAGLFKKNFETFTDYKIGEDSKLTEDILAAGPIF